MKIIENITDWEDHKVQSRIWLDDNDKSICSYALELFDDSTKLTAVYVQPEYRNQGFTHLMLSDVLKIIKREGKINYLIVKKDYFPIKTYEKYGWEYDSDYDEDFNWMVLDNNKNKII